MPPISKPVRPIIVIKKKISHGGHHGGAWKVAYADFVTALMSLFIVLWLLNTTPQIKKAVAGYFNDPSSSQKQTGTVALGAGVTVSIDKDNVEKLKEEIEKAILKQADLNKLSKQIEITVTGEGLKIELIEDKGGTFFEKGSPKLSETGVTLLDMLSDQLKALPNHLLIEGHTDAQPYSSDNGYTNWELSSDRANSTRRVLQQHGMGPNQISQVRGYADQMLRVPSNPMDPSNRRISLIVQWVDASAPEARTARSAETGSVAKTSVAPIPTPSPAAISVPSSTPGSGPRAGAAPPTLPSPSSPASPTTPAHRAVAIPPAGQPQPPASPAAKSSMAAQRTALLSRVKTLFATQKR